MKSSVQLLFLVLLGTTLFSQTSIDISQITKVSQDGVEVALFDNKPFTGQVTEHYQNGKLKAWISYQDGFAEGLWQEWYESGQLRFNAQWRKGKGHGLWEYYHENGVLRQEEYYDMDIPVGVFRVFYNNGQVKTKSCWMKGRKDGTWTYYSETGILIKTEVYKNNELVSTTKG